MAVSSTDVVAGTNGTAPQYNNLRGDVVLGKNVYGVDTYGASIAIDWSDTTKGKVRTITLTGDPTITFSNYVVGQAIAIRFVQDGTAGHTPTLPSGIIYPSGSTPTFSSTPNAVDLLIFICTNASTPTFDCYFGGFDLQ